MIGRIHVLAQLGEEVLFTGLHGAEDVVDGLDSHLVVG